MSPEKWYKLCKFCGKSLKEYAPVGRLKSTFWSNLSKNFSFGVVYPYCWTDGGEICQISPHRCNMSPLPGEQPQNRPL